MKAVRLAALGLALAALFALPALAATSEERGLTVTGTGSVSLVPDVAQWSFGVETRGATAREALRRNSVEMRRVIDALKAVGVTELQTQQVSVYPRTNGDGSRVTGYTATNGVAATAPLSKAGDVVDAAVDAGANQVSGPFLTVAQSDEAYAQALDQAFDKARAKAQRLAAKAGVTLGRPIAIVEGGGNGVSPAADRAAGEAASVPIEAGTTKVSAVVTVTFAMT
jgi:uncharacterized protein YggE